MNAPLDIKSYMLEVGRRARAASREVARAASPTPRMYAATSANVPRPGTARLVIDTF